MSHPIIAVECKRYKRKLNIKDVETFIGMKDDIGAEKAILVCPIGFSKAAIRRAKVANVVIHRLTISDAKRLNLREIARQTFPWDEAFHPVMGDALLVLDASPSFDDWVESLEELPFEEWETTAALQVQFGHTAPAVSCANWKYRKLAKSASRWRSRRGRKRRGVEGRRDVYRGEVRHRFGLCGGCGQSPLQLTRLCGAPKQLAFAASLDPPRTFVGEGRSGQLSYTLGVT